MIAIAMLARKSHFLSKASRGVRDNSERMRLRLRLRL